MKVIKGEHSLHVASRLDKVPVTVTLLGRFTIGLDRNSAGPWPRPPARRVCEMLMLSPDRRLLKEVTAEILFSNRAPKASACALSKALSMARQALLPLGAVGAQLLRTDRDQIYTPAEIPVEIDLVTHEAALRCALATEPGRARDAALSAALLDDGVLLADEPYGDWALERRDALDMLRQRARLELARDRTNGYGRSQLDAIIDAWEMCLTHDLASEEAGITLMRSYAIRGQRQLVVRVYRRCRQGLEELGLIPSPAMEEAYRKATDCVTGPVAPWYMGSLSRRPARRLPSTVQTMARPKRPRWVNSGAPLRS